MFKRLRKNKKAQQTAEYALLISLVVAAVIAMQTYAQRSIQAKIRDAAMYMTQQTTTIGSLKQYEPYYLKSEYTVNRDESTTETLGTGETGAWVKAMISNRDRTSGGYQESTYCNVNENDY
jgi:Flp pilus assembly pilin Flp